MKKLNEFLEDISEGWVYSTENKVMSKNIGGQVLKFEIEDLGNGDFELTVSNPKGDEIHVKKYPFDTLIKKLDQYNIKLDK